MDKVYFEKQGGMGLISDFPLNGTEYIKPENCSFFGKEIQVGQKTNLYGFYDGEAEYVGKLKDEEGELLVFYLGCIENLFSGRHYYSCVYRLDDNSIAVKYTEKTVRDYHFKENLSCNT